MRGRDPGPAHPHEGEHLEDADRSCCGRGFRPNFPGGRCRASGITLLLVSRHPGARLNSVGIFNY